MRRTLAVVSIGSNEGCRESWLKSAREALAALPGTRMLRESRVRETEPVDVPDEYREMKFLNQAVLLETSLEVHEFSRLMHGIEDELGRVRTVRNGPRNIDIDLILFGGEILDEPNLTIPHPRAKSRDFVMEPLREVMRGRAWAAFLRLPNIGTAFGDAIAGALMAALSLGVLGGGAHFLSWSAFFGWRQVLCASFTVALLYLFGLADNDIVDMRADEVKSPLRPLAFGLIGLGAAKCARAALLAAAFAAWIVAIWGDSLSLLLPFALLSLAIALYNRIKSRFPIVGVALMGLCRGGALLLGALAACGFRGVTLPVGLMALGWAIYISSVTLLGLNEESASKPLGWWRYLGALAAFAPLASFIGLLGVEQSLLQVDIASAITIPFIGALATATSWVVAVAPLGAEHTPQERGRAVGMVVSGLLYLQVGFMLAVAMPATALAAPSIWLLSRAVRRFSSRFVPQVTGS